VTAVDGELAELDEVFATDLRPLAVLDDGKLLCKNRRGIVKCYPDPGLGGPDR
jgi:hypothetical protein